jgi:ATP-binding cassette subfamily B protein
VQDEEVLGKAYDARLMRRLIRYLRPYWKQVLFAFLLIVVDAALETLPPLLTMLAIDRYIAAADVGGLAIVAGAYMLTLTVKFGTEFIQALTLQRTGQRIMFDMRMQIFRHLQSLSPRGSFRYLAMCSRCWESLWPWLCSIGAWHWLRCW